jgi:hypothetical protein
MEKGFCTYVSMFYDLFTVPTCSIISRVNVQFFATSKFDQDPDHIGLAP